jgi:hypothetical protein
VAQSFLLLHLRWRKRKKATLFVLACGGFGLGQWLLSLLTRKIVKEVDMISRLEQAIECGVLPERIDIYRDNVYLGVDIVDKKYWVGYENEGHQHIGPQNNNLFGDYFETLDEAVDALIPVLWAEEDRELYEKYCLDLVYEIMVRPASLALEIKELGISNFVKTGLKNMSSS